MKHRYRMTPLALVLAVSAGHAADLTDWLQLNGFGTLGAYRADDKVASVRADQRTANASLDKTRFDGDTLLSGQLTAHNDGPFRAVLQVLDKDDVARHWHPRVEWLYASWDATADLNFKVGRTVLPLFLLSDTRNVAYAQTTVRPDNAVYQLNPITNLDGVSGTWGTKLFGGDLGVDAVYGSTKVTVAAGSVKAKDVSALAVKWSNGTVTLRAAHSQLSIDASLPSTEAAITRLESGATGCTNCAAVLPALASTSFKAQLNTVAAVYESGSFAAQAEWVSRPTTSALTPDANAWYLQSSYRLGAFTPYGVVGKLNFREAPLGLTTAAAAPPAAHAANSAFDTFLQSQNDRRIWQIGTRWDFAENMALKLQYESFRNTRNSTIGVTNVVSYPSPPPIGTYAGPKWDGKVNLVTLNFDFVF